MGRGSATLCLTVRVPKIALFNLLMAVIFNNHYRENITGKTRHHRLAGSAPKPYFSDTPGMTSRLRAKSNAAPTRCASPPFAGSVA